MLVILLLFRCSRRTRRRNEEKNNTHSSDDTEYWISIGSIYLCISYLVFTSASAVFQFLRQRTAEALRANREKLEFYLPYMNLYRNFSVLCVVFYMSFAFVVYIIQNKNLRKIIVEILYIIFTGDYPPNSVENEEQRKQQSAQNQVQTNGHSDKGDVQIKGNVPFPDRT